MEAFADFLQKNPYIIVFLFLASLVGLIASWQPFYAILKRSVKVPTWLVFVVIVLWVMTYFTRKSEDDEPQSINDLVKITGQDFGVETLKLDGNLYQRCTFNGSQLYYTGKGACGFQQCKFNGFLVLFDEGAANTIDFLSALYKEPSTRSFVEQTFQHIRNGGIPAFPKPDKIRV